MDQYLYVLYDWQYDSNKDNTKGKAPVIVSKRVMPCVKPSAYIVPNTKQTKRN